MNANLIKSIEAIGCETEGDILRTLDCLEVILRNPHDRKRLQALSILRTLEQSAGEQAWRVASLLALHAPPKSLPLLPPVRYPISPDDPQWGVEIKRLADQGADPAAVADFCKALVTTFDNRLRQANHQERQAFLIKHRELFVAAVELHGLRMLPASRVILTEWIAESDALRLESLLRKARAWRQPGLWEQVRDCAAELQKSPQASDRSIGKAEESAALADRYFIWRRRFELFIDSIRRHDFASELAFPWSPRAAGGMAPSTTLEQAEAAIAGLADWGASDDQSAWQEAAQGLSRRALNELCATADRPPRQALDSMLALRAQWPSKLGALPGLADWDQAEQRLRMRLAELVTQWLSVLRSRFQDRARSLAEFDAHPDLPYLDSVAAALRQRFIEDLETLGLIDHDLGAWWESGEIDALHDQRLAGLERELDRLAEEWRESPGYRGYRDRLGAVRTELGLLERAQEQIRNGDADSALETLARCQSPAARLLETNARQASLDHRIGLALRQGELDRIDSTDLAQASPEVRTLHGQIARGRAFVEDLRQRAQAIPSSDLQSLARAVLALLATQPPSDAVLSEADSTGLADLREGLRRQLFGQANLILKDVRARARLFPVLDAAELGRIEGQVRDLDAGLALSRGAGLVGFEADQLEDSLLPVRKALRVHRASIDGDWSGAESELADPAMAGYLDRRQRRELNAAVHTARLLREHGSDSDWLALYRELSDVLMGHTEFRNRYLHLLRKVSDGHEGDHWKIIDRWLPDESYVSKLLACFVASTAADEIDSPPNVADEPLFKRLLEHLAQSPLNYRPVARLWQLVPDSARARVWSGSDSPVDRLAALLSEEQSRILASLSDPQARIVELKARLDALSGTGLLDMRIVNAGEIAAMIDRRMAEFERQDPWNIELRPLLEQTRRDLGRLPPGVAEARGWTQAVERRIEGIRAWDDLADAWDAFNKPFNAAKGHSGLFVGFHYDAKPWGKFRELLRGWIESLQRAIPRLHWDLPGAAQSAQWRTLIGDWFRSPEGLLWQAEQGCTPTEPAALCDAYCRVAEQIDEFAELHAHLLEGVSRPLLVQLRDLRPLSRPVAEIKRQLTDPEVAVQIGAAYQQLVAELDPQ